MNKNSFITESMPKTNIIYCTVIAMFEFFIGAVIYFLIPQVKDYVFYIGSIFIICTVGVGIFLSFSPKIILKFNKKTLIVRDSNYKEYTVHLMEEADFVAIQTPIEKKLNIGMIRIKNTSLFMFGIKNIAETKEYINSIFEK